MVRIQARSVGKEKPKSNDEIYKNWKRYMEVRKKERNKED